MTRERRSPDRPIKRLRQLQARLDVLLQDSQTLRRRIARQQNRTRSRVHAPRASSELSDDDVSSGHPE